ncbi:MAG: hypothetical protein JW776_15145 [Candidatus Lokiarchaeota archaeon]|nr:hypothetical protein [Candidatus Lokiarchaeota archaeon]
MREEVIKVRNENNPDKKEELITSYAFDAMSLFMEGIDSLFLKSQGNAINVCIPLALEIERRLKRQMVSFKRKIYINSRFFTQNYKGKKSSRNPMDNLNILSYCDIRYYFTKSIAR